MKTREVALPLRQHRGHPAGHHRPEDQSAGSGGVERAAAGGLRAQLGQGWAAGRLGGWAAGRLGRDLRMD